jgi:hypothetical protein
MTIDNNLWQIRNEYNNLSPVDRIGILELIISISNLQLKQGFTLFYLDDPNHLVNIKTIIINNSDDSSVPTYLYHIINESNIFIEIIKIYKNKNVKKKVTPYIKATIDNKDNCLIMGAFIKNVALQNYIRCVMKKQTRQNTIDFDLFTKLNEVSTSCISTLNLTYIQTCNDSQLKDAVINYKIPTIEEMSILPEDFLEIYRIMSKF